MLKNDYETIRNSEEFRKMFSGGFLVSCFLNETSGNEENSSWEYNFYSKETKQTNSFVIKDGKVILRDKSELTGKKEPEELILDNLSLRKAQIMPIIKAYMKEEQKNEKISKVILVVESEDHNINWSVILILNSSKIIKLKIDDSSFKIAEKKVISLSEMVAQHR